PSCWSSRAKASPRTGTTKSSSPPWLSKRARRSTPDSRRPVLDNVDPQIFRLAIFVLAVFVGYYVVWSVTPALHTPLMAVTNAISSVIIVGALLAAGANSLHAGGTMAKAMGGAGIVLASVNIFGGFLVTQRMLAMYKKKPGKD